MALGFSLVGKVVVPPERRDELNGRVLEILWRSGLRKRVTVEVAGEPYQMVRRAVPDACGIVSFDWSLFDTSQVKEGAYDTTTCELHAADEPPIMVYSAAAGSIMTLLQAYSTEPCLMVYENKPCYTGRFRGMVDDLLGEEIDWPLGPGVWDGMCVLHEHPELDEMTPGELYGIIPVELCGWRVDEAVVRMYLDDETVKEATEEELSALERGEDVSRPNGLSLLFTLMKREVGDTSFEGWMRQLLSGDVDERKRLAEAAGGSRAAIARISVQWPAPIVLHRYAYARGEELFDVFDRLGITLYRDFESFTLNSVPCRCDGITIRGFFRTLCLDEQWALGVADDHYLSDELRAGLASWKRRYDACVVSEDASMEDLLARFLRLMSGAWECHPVDTSFVDVMRTHADDERYLRLATIMVDVALEGTETVPELMPWQAITWVLKRERGEYFPRLLSTFAGLVANADLVRQVFGIGD